MNDDARPRILLTRRWPAEVEARLAERYRVTLNDSDMPMNADALAVAMREQDALCPTVTDRITRAVIEVPGARVRIIANYGAGFEHIDRDAARDAGIVVTTPQTC